MKQRRMARLGLTSLLCESRGATGVEYGMLAGAVAIAIGGMVLALGGNIAAVFDSTDRVITGTDDAFGGHSDSGPLRVIARQTFTDGRAGWSGKAPTRSLDQIGTGLSLSGESRLGDGLETVSRSFDIPAGTTRAEFSFDMSFVDSWDDEQAKIYVNGTLIGTGTFSYRGDAPRIDFVPTPGVTATAERTASVQAGTWEDATGGTDYVHAVRIAIDNPGETVTLGFGTTLDQTQMDESLLIGNVELRVGP